MLNKANQILNERFVFLSKFAQSPNTIGSITPSSSFLVKKMLGDLPWGDIGVIVELGAGTGVFTKYIDRYKKDSCKAVIIEKDSQLRQSLADSYPSFYFAAQAARLDSTMWQLDMGEADCIISGLPFAMFSPELREQIMEAALRSLKPGGLFIAFQYSLQMKSMLERYFNEIDISLMLFNLPPAFVYRCRKLCPSFGTKRNIRATSD